MKKGLFITFEGVEGAGKTTQIRILKEYLEKSGYKVEVTREPGGTPIGEQIREVLLNPENKGMNYLTELLLYYSSRAQHIHEKILKLKNEGTIVICDRFSDSTMAYQGYGRGLDKTLLTKLGEIVEGENRPDVTIIIDIDPEKSLERAKRKQAFGAKGDRLEQEKLDFHKKVWQGFREIAKDNPNRVYLLNGENTIEGIAEEIKRHVMKNIENIK